MPWDQDAEAFECDDCGDWTDSVMALTPTGVMALTKPEVIHGSVPPPPRQATSPKVLTLCMACWAKRQTGNSEATLRSVAV